MSSPKVTKYQELKDTLHKFLHSDNPIANTLKMAEKYTKVDRKYIALGKRFSPSRRGAGPGTVLYCRCTCSPLLYSSADGVPCAVHYDRMGSSAGCEPYRLRVPRLRLVRACVCCAFMRVDCM